MLELNAQHIHMHQVAADKPAALALLGEVLVADGLVAPGYGRLARREARGSTFLGEGIAIPMAPRKPAIRCSARACGCCIFRRASTGATASRSTLPSASPRVPTSICVCCSC